MYWRRESIPTQLTIGDYEVLRPIGAGGMAALYLCRKRSIGGFERQVVVKILMEPFIHQPSHVDMFMYEAKIMAAMSHPNLVSVFELSMAGAVPFIAMEYVRGPNLCRLASMARARGETDLLSIVTALADACAGLHYAHELRGPSGKLGLVHRDVSPNNILVSEHGVVKLIDFGIARCRERQEQGGGLNGKVQFLAPEQIIGAKTDHRVDLFAMGVSLYVLTTGVNPFPKGTDARALSNRLKGTFRLPSTIIPGYPAALEAIVCKAMHVDPDQRYQTARSLQHALKGWSRAYGADSDRLKGWVKAVFPECERQWHHTSEGRVGLASRAAMLASSGGEPPTVARSRGFAAAMGVGLALLVGVGGAYGMLSNTKDRQAQHRQRSADALVYLEQAASFVAEDRLVLAQATLDKVSELALTDASITVRTLVIEGELEKKRLLFRGTQQLKQGDREGASQTVAELLASDESDVRVLALAAALKGNKGGANTQGRAAQPKPKLVKKVLLASKEPTSVRQEPRLVEPAPREDSAELASVKAPMNRVLHSSKTAAKVAAEQAPNLKTELKSSVSVGSVQEVVAVCEEVESELLKAGYSRKVVRGSTAGLRSSLTVDFARSPSRVEILYPKAMYEFVAERADHSRGGALKVSLVRAHESGAFR